MSEASFDSEKNASQDNQLDPKEQGLQNTAESLSQSEARKNSLDETHMTEIDISENKEVGYHNNTLSKDGDEDEDSQAHSKTSGIIEDNRDSETSSVATDAEVKVTNDIVSPVAWLMLNLAHTCCYDFRHEWEI